MSDLISAKQKGGRITPAACFFVLFLFFLDQAAKQWAKTRLAADGPIVLIRGVLELLYTENTGAAFGILKGHQWFFYLAALLAALFSVHVFRKLPLKNRFLPLRLILCFVAAGAFGNVADRLRYGYVVDFIYFRLIDFPVFNVADIYITVSCFAAVWLLLFYYRDDEWKLL